jgi:hypothetical protein
MEYESIQITSLRKNGLRLIAKQNRRSMLQQLDLFLEKSGVPDLSNKELQSALKQNRGEEILVARK